MARPVAHPPAPAPSDSRTTPVYRYEAYGNGTDAFPQGNKGDLFVKPAYPINVNNGE